MRDIAIPRVYGNIMIDHVKYPRLDRRVGAFLCRDPSHGTAAAATTTDEVALEQRNDFGRGRRGGEDDFANGPTTDSGRRGGF